MRRVINIIFFSFSWIVGFSQQSTIDSLKMELATPKSDTNRMQLVIELSDRYATINIDSSILYGKQGVQMARASRNKDWELHSLSVLANALSERDIPQSMQVSYQWLQLAEKMKNLSQVALCYQQIGLLYLYLGNGNLYIEYLQKAKAIYKNLGDLAGEAACDSEIGSTYVAMEPDSARHYLTLAIRDSVQRRSAFNSYFWGRLESVAHPQKAREYFYESVQRFKEAQNLRGLSLANRWFSIFYEQQSQLDSAIITARNGLVAAQQLNFLRGIMNNSGRLTLIYKKLNQTDSAYKYVNIMVAAKDSLLSPDKINQIQAAIIEEQQRVQKLQGERTSVKNKIKLYAAVATGLVLLIFALFFYRNQRRIQRSHRLLQIQRDEINDQRRELQNSLDTLKATQQQLVQSEKMASLGELTAGIAHEIQNPLNFVNNFSEVNSELIAEMKDELKKGNIEEAKTIANDIDENEQKIIFHGKRADSIVKGMLQHSRSSSGVKEPTNINALADEYLRLAYHGLRAKDKSFNAIMKTDFDESIGNINIIPQDIGRVILNLFTNAFYVVHEKKKQQAGAYEPTVSVSTKKMNGTVEISVKDNGNGIPQKVLDKIFQPFFTTKPTGQGTGLGLSMSYDIVKAHGGELKVETKEGAGSGFIVTIPIG